VLCQTAHYQASHPHLPICFLSSTTLRVNAYWFLSLALSLTCALIATLVKQWGRRFLQEVNRHPAAYKRARIRSFLFQGLQTFKMPVVVDAVLTLLHVSLSLFFIGSVEFLYPINHLLAYILLFVFCCLDVAVRHDHCGTILLSTLSVPNAVVSPVVAHARAVAAGIAIKASAVVPCSRLHTRQAPLAPAPCHGYAARNMGGRSCKRA